MAGRSAVVVLAMAQVVIAGCAAGGGSEAGSAPPRRPSASAPVESSPATSSAAQSPTAASPTASSPTPAGSPSGPVAGGGAVGRELPGGGRSLFPRHRLVGYAGSPFSPALGRLGTGDLDRRAREIRRLGRQYGQGRTILPVFELIATMATSFPGRGRAYRVRTDDATIRRYLAAARRQRALLLLNIQPGRADFGTEVRAYERWLREPDVGLALDPEWAVGPSGVPGRVYGQTTGAELDGVARYLSGLVSRYDLPEKALVFHQVAPSVVRAEQQLRPHPGVAVIKSVDGIGSPGAKRSTWLRLVRGKPAHVHTGFKLFFTEDRRAGPLMTPRQVLALRPVPAYVMYE